MPAVDTSPGTRFAHRRPTSVKVRDSVADEWTDLENVRVESMRNGVSPSIGAAVIAYEYGKFISGNRGKLSLNRKFVRIDLVPISGLPLSWYGIVVNTATERIGTDPLPTGNQTFQCRALEWLLSRYIVRSSVVRNPSSVDTVGRGLTFNAALSSPIQSGRRRFANRYVDEELPGGYLFTDDLAAAVEWTAADIVEYLFANHTIAGSLQFALSPFGKTVLESYKPPNIVTDGRTLYQILNSVIDRRQGYTWSLSVTTDDDDFILTLDLHPYTDVDVVLPNAGTLPANPDLITWDFDDQHDIGSTVVVDDSSTEYEQVVVRGGRRGACFSASYVNLLLKAGWSASEQTAYADGAKNNVSYAGWDDSRKKLENDAIRSADTLDHVYSRHVLALDTWDGKSGDPTSVSRPSPICPTLEPDGSAGTGVTPIWLSGIRFENFLPLEENSENARPFAVVKLPVKAPLSESVEPVEELYAYVDRLDSSEEVQSGIEFTCHVRMLDDFPGVSIRATGAPHLMAGTQWTGAEEPSNYKATLDFTDLIVTVNISWDEFVTAKYPEPASAAVNDQVSELVIDVGDRGRLDWVCEGTVVGLEDGQLKRLLTGQFYRDDREWMQDLARIAWLWSSQTRRAVNVTQKSITTEITPGQYLQSIGGTGDVVDIGSVVTSVEWDFAAGTTTVRTQFGELDWVQLARRTA